MGSKPSGKKVPTNLQICDWYILYIFIMVDFLYIPMVDLLMVNAGKLYPCIDLMVLFKRDCQKIFVGLSDCFFPERSFLCFWRVTCRVYPI